MLYAQGTKNSEGDAMNDDDDYSMIDEFMHWVTIAVLFLMTTVFLGAVVGIMYWAMI